MKYRTTLTVALTSLAIFLALAVAGGICVAAGFADYAKNSDVIDNVGDIFEYVEGFDFDIASGDTEKASADYVRELRSDVEKVVLSTGGCSIDVRNGSEFSVSFSGKVNAGKFADSEQDEPKAVGNAETAAYYDNSGIIDASFNNGVLEIKVESAMTINIVGFNSNASLGHVTVTFPDTYAGSFELQNSFAEVDIAGVDFDELTLDGCMGEVSVNSCNVNMFTVTKLAGEVEAEGGKVAGVRFEDIAGEINVESLCPLTVDSLISDVAGEINIELPYGSGLDVSRDDVLGEVSVDRDVTDGESSARLDISDVVGEITIDIYN